MTKLYNDFQGQASNQNKTVNNKVSTYKCKQGTVFSTLARKLGKEEVNILNVDHDTVIIFSVFLCDV